MSSTKPPPASAPGPNAAGPPRASHETPRHSVLVVDDDPAFAEMVADDLRDDDLAVVALSDPREALKLAEQGRFSVVVVDLVMPEIDGLELSRELRKRDPETQVLVLTGHGSIHSAIAGIRNEVFDYLQKGAVNAVRLRRAVRAAIARRQLRRGESLRHPGAFADIADALVGLLDAQDVHHSGHSRAVAMHSDEVASRLGLSEEERRTIHFAALLHDVGKLRLGPSILAAAGSLGEEDRRRMREHPILGTEILEPLVPWPAILPIVHAHHERWDGAGYPRGLQGEQIPLGARIVAVAEAFDAMTRSKPYAARRSPDQALGELEAQAGAQFDPGIGRAFVEEYRERGGDETP